MSADACDGWIRTLRGEVIVFTGRVWVDDERVAQAACGALAERHRARWRSEPSGAVSLVVHGELAGSTVVDTERQYSEKLVFAQEQRSAGRHVHVVDSAGFSDLLHRRPARCRRLRGGGGRVRVVHDLDDSVFGELFDPDTRPVPKKSRPKTLNVDLTGLDRATAAHELTLQRLAEVLSQAGAHPHVPVRRGPQFDLGWRWRRRLYVAELKSLTGTEEAQQIRLGFGQVLDYVTQLAVRNVRATPVVVLERRPAAKRWLDLAERTGVLLTFGPDFEDAVRVFGRT